MAKDVENLKRQVIPILKKVPASGTLKLYLLKEREILNLADNEISQDILDKEAAGILTVTVSA